MDQAWNSLSKRALVTVLTLIMLIQTSACQQSPETSATMTVLALGDSYTIGEGVAVAERWPVQLIERLTAQGFVVETPTIIATTGWTTADLEDAIANADLAPPYDLVTLLIGVNDQYQGRSEEAYREGFGNLLARAADLAAGDPQRVIVLSIPDYSVTPFARRLDPEAIQEEIEWFNVINRGITETNGAHYVDVTSISRKAADDATLLAGDGLHPSREMYTEWVALVVPVAVEILTNAAENGGSR